MFTQFKVQTVADNHQVKFGIYVTKSAESVVYCVNSRNLAQATTIDDMCRPSIRLNHVAYDAIDSIFLGAITCLMFIR